MARKAAHRQLPVPRHQSSLAAGLQRIVLEGTDHDNIFDRELRGIELVGLLRHRRSAGACNIVETVIHDFRTEDVDFTRCDLKDNAIRSTRFVRTHFDSSSIAYNTVAETVFEACTFNDTDIQHCEFSQTVFVRCDLTNLLVKACAFSRCEFRECVTSNKVFEMCRLTDCEFHDTEIQLQTLTENFGIIGTGFHGRLRDNRKDVPHRQISPDNLAEWLKATTAHPLQKLNVHYFLTGTLLEGSPYLDKALDLTSWMRMFKTAGSFSVVLNRWVEFLLWLYERDQLTTHVLVQLHSMTNGLLQSLEGKASHHAALATLNGVHLSLARVVDQYLVVLDRCAALGRAEVNFLVEGHQTKKYYYRVLAPLFSRADVRITKLVRHNSPWDLGLTFAPGSTALFFMALFLSTRTRIELGRLTARLSEGQQDPATPGPVVPADGPVKRSSRAAAVPSSTPIFTLDFGGAASHRAVPNFRLRAYLPGNLVADLQLDLASQRIAKLRKAVKDLL